MRADIIGSTVIQIFNLLSGPSVIGKIISIIPMMFCFSLQKILLFELAS